MSFMYPLGLLGLIGIPILIIIYIIKNKYTEQVVASTYIWELSEKFLKRRNPINKIVGIISLILQILAVLFISVAVARPVFAIPNAAYEYCFVLDGSGSMNIRQGDKTRLDLGKEKISSIIKSSLGGCSYSLVYAGATTDVIYERTENKEQALKLLNELEPAYLNTGYTDAVVAAQKYFNEYPSVRTYLVTDKEVELHDNVEVINVSSRVENYALSDVEYKFTETGLLVEGKAVSYESDAELEIELYVDEEREAKAKETVRAAKLEATPFTFNVEVTGFEKIRAVIKNRDALSLDNEVVIYSPEPAKTYKALVVSDTPFYIYAALSSEKSVEVEAVPASDYVADSGYNLYIFDGVENPVMPKDGAVWFVNPRGSVADSGFTVQNEVELAIGEKLSYSASSYSVILSLKNNLIQDDIYVKEYAKCGGFTRKFSTLLTHDGNSVVFVGTNRLGNREAVVAFDLSKSNLPMLADYRTLIGNLIKYTFPNVLDRTTYTCGETAALNVEAACDSIRVDSPAGNVFYLNTGSDVAELHFTEAGVYTVTVSTGGSVRKYYAYAALPEEERQPSVTASSFSLSGTAENHKKSGTYDSLLAWFIILAVLVAADWMVYCYEQYQLR